MSSGKEPDKCAFSYMDGIPVKISEKFKPPGKVTLPLSIQRLLNSPSSHEQYDFSLERGVLDKLEQWKKHLESQQEERLKKIAEEENWSKMLEETMKELHLKEVAPAQVSSPTTCEAVVSQQTQEVEVPAAPQVTTAASIPTTDSRYPTHPILTPVPLAYSVPVVQTSNTAFNISDFEADTSSPFDNMELKTLNDMEELAHVLQPATSVSDGRYFPANTTPNFSAPQAVPVATTSTYVPAVRQSALPIPFVPTSGSNLIHQLPQYDKSLVGVHPHLNGYASTYNAYTSVDHTQQPQQPQQPQHHQIHPIRETFSYMPVDTTHHYQFSSAVNSSVIPVRTVNCSDQTVYNYNVERKPMPQSSVPQYPFNNMYNYDTSKPWLTSQMYDQPMAVRPVTQDTSSLATSDKAPLSVLQPLQTNGPDFAQEIGQLIKKKKFDSESATTSHCGKTNSNHPQIENPKCYQVEEQLPSLSSSAQQLVEQIAEMGFPLSRVARAYSSLGDNGKTIVEYLLSVQALVERGFSEKQVEQALKMNNNDFAAAESFMAAQAQLLDLGFPEDKVVDALVKFNCNRDKALEFLIT